MKQQQAVNQTSLPYNKSVTAAYQKVLKGTKQLISSVEQHEIRCTYQRANKSGGSATVINELINPIIYLSLQCNDGEHLSIHFGFEFGMYPKITAKFIRLLFKATSLEQTELNVEDCISTEYVLTDCSALYETIEDGRNRQHTFILIDHKQTVSKRKQMKAVA